MYTLKQVRQAAGLTQRELARLACVSRAAVSHAETARIRPTARFAGKVCRALGQRLGCVIHTWQLFPEHFLALLPDLPQDDNAAAEPVCAAPQRRVAGGRS